MNLDIKKIKEELYKIKDTNDIYLYINKVYDIIQNTSNYVDKFNIYNELMDSKDFFLTLKSNSFFLKDVAEKLVFILERITDDIGQQELDNIKNEPKNYIDKLSEIIFNTQFYTYKVFLIERLGILKINELTRDFDQKQKNSVIHKINTIAKDVIKNIESVEGDSEDKRQALLYAKWSPYIATYNANLHEIKKMIETCRALIYQNMVNWASYNSAPKLNMINIIYELKKCETEEKVIVCTLLRRIIETIFALKVLNNKNSSNGNYKNQGLSSYYKFFKKENIDWKIKTLIVVNHEERNYKYAVSKIWKNANYLTKTIYNKLLSNNIHQRWENIVYFKSFNQAEDLNKINNYVKKKYDELEKLLTFLSELELSLKNHLVEFEKGKLKAIVLDFNIVEQDINSKIFDFEKNYKIEEFTDKNYEFISDIYDEKNN